MEKNVHILPTEKSSRLAKHSTGSFHIVEDKPHKKGLYEMTNQNIYITNSEDIKEWDWCLSVVSNYIYRAGLTPKTKWGNQKKIVLTTDQHLIKDGVQQIPDDFLEFIVNNPSCEYIEVQKVEHLTNMPYRIILPKEEQKQLNPKDFGLPEFGTKEFNDLCYKFMGGKLKQEPLEEVAERLYPINIVVDYDTNEEIRNIWLSGAKYQQEQDKNKYSEKEVWSIINMVVGLRDGGKTYSEISNYFEQYKKK